MSQNPAAACLDGKSGILPILGTVTPIPTRRSGRRQIIACMHLLERDRPLAELEQRLQEARDGAGKVVLLTGEAGVGKSSLVEAFVHRQQSDAPPPKDRPDAVRRPATRVVWGTCDALSTPRALGPIHDIAAQMPGPAGNGDQPGARDQLFRHLLLELSRTDRTSIVVVEDLHWADEATLDFHGGRLECRTTAR